MGQIIKVQRPVSSAPINGLYYRPVCDFRGRIYNSFAGGIIVQFTIRGHKRTSYAWVGPGFYD
jgi:hypothetical protein